VALWPAYRCINVGSAEAYILVVVVRPIVVEIEHARIVV